MKNFKRALIVILLILSLFTVVLGSNGVVASAADSKTPPTDMLPQPYAPISSTQDLSL